MATQLRNVSGSSVSRWRILAELRRRRQIVASEQLRQPSQQQPGHNTNSSTSVDDLYEETLFSPSPPQRPTASSLPPPTPAAQQVLSLIQQSQPLHAALSDASFQPSVHDLVSLLDHLSETPQLALQTLIWSLRNPRFSASPLIASKVEPLLPPPRPVSVQQFLSDAHAFWMHRELAMPASLLEPLLSLYCYASPSFDETVEVINSIIVKGGNPSVHHFNKVLQSAVSKQHNRLDGAQWLFTRMQKSGPAPNVVSYNILIYGHCEAENPIEAFRLFDEMISNGLPANDATYSNLISTVVKAWDLDKALQLLQEMKYNGLRPSTETYGMLIGGLCARGVYQTAAVLIKEMHGHGLSIDDGNYQRFVASLSQALAVPEAQAQSLLEGESSL